MISTSSSRDRRTYIGDKDNTVMKVFRRPEADSLACKAFECHWRYGIADDATPAERISASKRTAHRLDTREERRRKGPERTGRTRAARQAFAHTSSMRKRLG